MRGNRVPSASVASLLDGLGGRWVADSVSPASRWLEARADSRMILPGEIFVALSGNRTDGHHHLEEARLRGARFGVVTRPVPGSSLPQVLVPDAMLALREMGRQALEAHRAAGHRMVALTGSVGKTTTKELLRLALSGTGKTHATQANENNELGVPLTILSWPPDAPFCVLEVGVRKPSDIDYLSPLLQAEVGIITAIGPGHLENLKTVQDVWAEKSKLLKCVLPGGTRIVAAKIVEVFSEDPLFRDRTRRLLVGRLLEEGETFLPLSGGLEGGAVAIGRLESGNSGMTLCLDLPDAKKLRLPLSRPSRALAWCSFLALLGVIALSGDPERALERIAGYEGLPGRLERRLHPSGVLMLLDHYNANPESMREALFWLVREIDLRKGARGFAVLGDMLELGEESERYHEQIGGVAGTLLLEALWYRGTERTAFLRGFERSGGDAGRIRDALSFSDDLFSGRGPRKGDVLLVKGSRGMKLEEIIAPLIGSSPGASDGSRDGPTEGRGEG